MNEDTLVSIIVPVYNAGKFIEETIESVLAQTYSDWELLLVDDGSGDDSVAVIEAFLTAHPAVQEKIRLFIQPQNAGVAAARNRGLTEASGRYIAYLDADDLWFPTKLEEELRLLREKDAAFVFCSYHYGDKYGDPIGRIAHVPEEIDERQAVTRTIIFTSTVLFDTKKVDKELLRMPAVASEDTATWWQILQTGIIAYGLDKPLVVYRNTPGSLSSNKLVAIQRYYRLLRRMVTPGAVTAFFTTLKWGFRTACRHYAPKETLPYLRRPPVTVLIATRNEKPAYLRAAMESALSQTYENMDVLLIDDSDDEASLAEAARLAEDPRVTWLRDEKHRTVSEARNCGLLQAKGKYIAVFDGDDLCAPDRLERQVRYLEEHPRCQILGSAMQLMDEEGAPLRVKYYPRTPLGIRLYSALRSPIGNPSVMLRKSLIREGLLYDPSLALSEDLDLWLRALREGRRLENLREVLLRYRVSSDYVSRRTNKEQLRATWEVRRKNASLRYPLHSLFSLAGGAAQLLMPRAFLQALYRREIRHEK